MDSVLNLMANGENKQIYDLRVDMNNDLATIKEFVDSRLAH